jgi:hypothetical protein
LEVDIQKLGGFSYRQLILISVVSLFVEMKMTRWVWSEIPIFAYFKNFVLVACFLGFRLGCYFSRRRAQLVAMITTMLLLTLILKAPISPLRRSIAALPSLLGAGVEVHVWGVPALPTSWASVLLALSFVVPLFALIATAFIPCGQLVGWYLENAPKGVAAYSINVLASLAGNASWTLCARSRRPWRCAPRFFSRELFLCPVSPAPVFGGERAGLESVRIAVVRTEVAHDYSRDSVSGVCSVPQPREGSRIEDLSR